MLKNVVLKLNNEQLNTFRKQVKFNTEINKLYADAKKSQKLRIIVNEIKTNLIYEQRNSEQMVKKLIGVELTIEQQSLLEKYDIIKKKMLKICLNN